MHRTSLAAVMAVAFLIAAPMAGKSLADTIDTSNPFNSLICALDRGGSCAQTAQDAAPDDQATG